MPTWLRTALQYAPLAERAARGLARFVRRLRGRETPSLEDAREADARAKEAIERGRAPFAAHERVHQSMDTSGPWGDEHTPAESPRSKRRGDG